MDGWITTAAHGNVLGEVTSEPKNIYCTLLLVVSLFINFDLPGILVDLGEYKEDGGFFILF